MSGLGTDRTALAARVQWIEHCGVRIFRQDYSHLSEAQVLAVLGVAQEALMRVEAQASVRELIVIRGIKVTRPLLDAAIAFAEACDHKVMRTSVVGVTGNPGQGNYAASKAGMIGMSKSLAQEVASRGITVNCIAPGMIETAMTDALDEGQRARLLDAIPAAQLGTSEDIAAAALYLASDEAAYVTGQTLHVNGGMAMI